MATESNSTHANAPSLGELETVIEKMVKEGWSPRGSIGCRTVGPQVPEFRMIEYYVVMKKK